MGTDRLLYQVNVFPTIPCKLKISHQQKQEQVEISASPQNSINHRIKSQLQFYECVH